MSGKEDRKALFETVAVPKALATFAVPTVISQMINLIYNLADTFFVGRTGNPYMIAGVSVSTALFMMLIALANLFGVGGGSQMSRLLGLGEHERAKKVSAFSFYGAIGIAAIYMLAVLLSMDPLLRLLGASDQTIVYARQYTFYVVVLGSVPAVLSNELSFVFRSIGYARKASIGLSAGGILNIILDPLFMFVLLPSGNEVTGAALATLISNTAVMLYFVVEYVKLRKESDVSIDPRDIAADPRDIREVFSVGIPSTVLVALVDLGNAFSTIHMAGHGDLQLAAYGLVTRAERVPMAFNLGLSIGMLPLAAYNYAQSSKKRLVQILNVSRLAGLVFSGVCVVMYLIFARPVVTLFLNTSASGSADTATTLEYAASFLRLRCLASPVIFLNFHSSYGLQAMGDGKSTFIHSVIRQLVIYIPILILMDKLFGACGLTASKMAAEALAFPVAYIMLRKKLNTVPDGKAQQSAV